MTRIRRTAVLLAFASLTGTASAGGPPERGVKGVYFAVGGTPAEQMGSAPSHHSPLFRIEPEPAVMLGVEAMVVATLTLLGAPPAAQ